MQNPEFRKKVGQFLWDVLKIRSADSVSTILDVGANIGQSATRYRIAFPSADIHAFEPVPETFDTLKAAMAEDGSVHCHNLALSDRSGSVQMSVQGTSVSNRIVARKTATSVTVETQRGDEFCASRGLEHIDLLKIDAEGHDDTVLHGFSGLIRSGSIDMIQVECSMNPSNVKHIGFWVFYSYLERFGYRLFRIYDQTPEFNRPWVLRRTNPVFVSPALSDIVVQKVKA